MSLDLFASLDHGCIVSIMARILFSFGLQYISIVLGQNCSHHHTIITVLELQLLAVVALA